jgi:hypothetical protein
MSRAWLGPSCRVLIDQFPKLTTTSCCGIQSRNAPTYGVIFAECSCAANLRPRNCCVTSALPSEGMKGAHSLITYDCPGFLCIDRCRGFPAGNYWKSMIRNYSKLRVLGPVGARRTPLSLDDSPLRDTDFLLSLRVLNSDPYMAKYQSL